MWSKKNVDTVGRLIANGRMTGHGLKQVEAAKADGRWDNAYGSGKDLKIPPDLQAAIDADPEARDMLGKLTEQNRFALAFRSQPQDRGRAQAQDRNLRGDAETRRDDLSAEAAIDRISRLRTGRSASCASRSRCRRRR